MIECHWPGHGFTGSIFIAIEQVFQHLFILLNKSTAAVIAQNAEENILVVGEVCHTLDQIDMRMLRSLTRCVFGPTPQNDFTHFVQDAVLLFKVPTQSPTHPVRQMLDESLQETLA